MRKTLTLLMTLLLTLSLLVACGEGDKSNNAAQPSDSGETTDKQGSNENDDIEVYWFDQYWRIEASVNQTIDEGKKQGLSGMYYNFQFNIRATSTNFYEQNPSVSGAYGLTVDSTITMNTDEAYGSLLSEALGEEVSGEGLGVFGVMETHYQSSLETGMSYVNVIQPNWNSTIRDSNGQSVTPEAGTLMLFESLELEYTGSGGQVFYGTFDTGDTTSTTSIHLYLLIEPDPTEWDMDQPEPARQVRVYIHLLDTDEWIEGIGQLFVNSDRIDLDE